MSEPTKEELMARIAELEKQAGSRKRGTLEFKVGEKGGVSVYGLGRFPVTLTRHTMPSKIRPNSLKIKTWVPFYSTHFSRVICTRSIS